MKRKALLTGATGYVGSHLAKRLLQDHWEVHLLARESSNLDRLKGLPSKPILHLHDGTTEQMLTLFQESRPDVVFHLASRVQVDHQPEDVEALIESNVLFGTQLLEGMVHAGVRSIVNTGSYWQYLNGDGYDPVNLYAATKQAFEDILRFYTAKGSLRALTLELFNVYGPSDTRDKLFQQLDRAYRMGESLLLSPGGQQLDFVYIDDVVEAFHCAAESFLRLRSDQGFDESYAVTSGRLLSLKEVVEIYRRMTGHDVKVIWGGRPYRKREVMKPWRGKPLPGWQAKVDLETALQRMMAQQNLTVTTR